jgi:hypothetical protein
MAFLTEVITWADQPRKLGKSKLNADRYPQIAGFRGMHMNIGQFENIHCPYGVAG